VLSSAGFSEDLAEDTAAGLWRFTFSPKRLQNVIGHVVLLPVRSSKI